MQKDLSKIDYAIRIRLESLDPESSSVTFETLIKVFNKIKRSFLNFVEIEFLRNTNFKTIYQNKPRVLENFKKDFELTVQNIDIDRLTAAIAPDIAEYNETLFPHEILLWKWEKFNSFKEDVIYGDYHNPVFIKLIAEKYNQEERVKIFKPIFDAISYDKEYKVIFIDSTTNSVRMFVPPHDIIKRQILSNEIDIEKLELAK